MLDIFRRLLCYDAFWWLKTIFGHLWHFLGSKSHLIIDQKNQKNVRFYRRVWGSISKSHLIFGQQKSENARYYSRVLRIKNNFQGGEGGGGHTASKSLLIIDHKKTKYARYYRRVFRIQNNFRSISGTFWDQNQLIFANKSDKCSIL